MNKKYIVYMHINKINNKKYIGQTCLKPDYRWKNGKGYLTKMKSGNYHQPLFARAILKYGWENFEHEILFENLTKDEANDLEIQLIKEFNTQDPNLGYNISFGGNNLPKSEMTKAKMSQAAHKNIGSKSHRAKRVFQYDKQGNFIKSWNCIKEASDFLNINAAGIGLCCKGKTRSCGGYQWSFVFSEKLNTYDNDHLRTIAQIDPKTQKVINIWNSLTDAHKSTGISLTCIGKVCSSCYQNKTAGGFIWKYI